MPRKLSALTVVALASIWLSLTDARAAFFYWSKFPVRTQSEPQCMQFAYGVAGRQGLQNIRQSPSEVAGSKGNAYVAITCVGRGGGQEAVAIVMVISDVEATATTVRDQIASELAKVVAFD